MNLEKNFTKLDALEEVAAKSNDVTIIVDTGENKVVFANAKAHSLLGIQKEDTLGKFALLLELIVPTDREYVKNKYRQVRKTPAISGIEFRLTMPSTDPMWLTCDTTLIDNDRYVYAVVRDISKEKEHENYLVEYGTRKNTLLDTVMHQLSGSLGLMNNLALKANKIDMSNRNEFDTFVTLVQRNSQHCIKIIDDLVKEEYSESPGIHVKFARVDLVKIIKYSFEEVKKSCGERQVSFHASSPVIFVTTDDFKLLQVINNFVSNSLKFTRKTDEIRFNIEQSENHVTISVADTGIGIPETLQPFLFEKHGPARRTGLAGEKSVGLGLSISRNLTQLLGGRIWFESTEGKGTTFYVKLPMD